MSFQVDSFRYAPCPCGKGTYKIVRERNDYGRTREYWEMLCPICKEALRLEEIPASEMTPAGPTYRWVPRDGKPDAPRPE
jgi:hypothetical protein